MTHINSKIVTFYLAIVTLFFTQICFATTNPKLIKLTKENKIIYLIGTTHVGKKDFYPLPKHIEEVFTKSDILAVEIDLSDSELIKNIQSLFAKELLFKDSNNINNYFNDEEVKQIKSIAPKEMKLIISHIRPWAISLMLSEQIYNQLGYKSDYGVDLYFLNKAKKISKPITELESINSQIKIFTSVSDENFAKILKTELHNFDFKALIKEYNDLILAWKDGDKDFFNSYAEDMKKSLKEISNESFFKSLLTNRNIAMVEKINAINENNIFVAVGALHLYGPDSVTDILKKQGYVETGIEKIEQK